MEGGSPEMDEPDVALQDEEPFHLEEEVLLGNGIYV